MPYQYCSLLDEKSKISRWLQIARWAHGALFPDLKEAMECQINKHGLCSYWTHFEPFCFFFFKDALELDSKSHPGWNCTLKEQEICPLVQTMIFFLFFCFLHQQNAPKKLQEHRKESKSLKLFTSLATYAWKRERNYTNQCIICLVLSFNLPPILFPHGTCSRQSITTHINWNGVLLIPNDDKFRLPLRLSWQN